MIANARTLIILALVKTCFVSQLMASTATIGPDGINSKVLQPALTGEDAIIGQVEPSRSGKAGFDTDAMKHHDQTVPSQVRRGTTNDSLNSGFIGEHATMVAGVMIAKSIGIGSTPDANLEGVAPNAVLYSASGQPSPTNHSHNLALAAQGLAGVDNMLAINLSFGNLEGPTGTDGNSFMSKFVDWSSWKHDILYVVGGPEIPPGENETFPVPGDNFNGITVGTSMTDAQDVFRISGFNNTFDKDADGLRTSIDILAPGVFIDMTGLNNQTINEVGTSYAAPHVTGTVALLGQFGRIQADNNNPRFDEDRFRHQVFKAIILNSADKLSGVLGSFRNVVNADIQDWKSTLAYNDSKVPLDEKLGAGHLNAGNAWDQYLPGEYDPSDPEESSTYVPSIGWDFHEIGGQVGQFHDYIFDTALPDNAYIAITLAWDRITDLTSGGDEFEFGQDFFSVPPSQNLSDLNLYLMPAASNNIASAVAVSDADADSVEHIFAQIENGGMYKIRVQTNATPFDSTEYGLAWRFGNPVTPGIPGDFDSDNDVDGADFLKWQRGESPNPLSAGDLTDWQNNYGTGSLAAVTVPEPSCLALLLLALIGWARGTENLAPRHLATGLAATCTSYEDYELRGLRGSGFLRPA